MPATCAACGVAIRKGVKFVVDGCYLLHRECQSLPRDAWTVHLAIARRVAELEARVADGEYHQRRIGGLLTDAESQNDHLRRELADAQTRNRGGFRSQNELTERLIQQGNELAETRLELRRVTAQRDAALSRQPSQVIAELDRLGAGALGLAIGRGIWGLAVWSWRVVLDQMDDSDARYSLLELK